MTYVIKIIKYTIPIISILFAGCAPRIVPQYKDMGKITSTKSHTKQNEFGGVTYEIMYASGNAKKAALKNKRTTEK